MEINEVLKDGVTVTVLHARDRYYGEDDVVVEADCAFSDTAIAFCAPASKYTIGDKLVVAVIREEDWNEWCLSQR